MTTNTVRTICVTGASGYIGSHIVRLLLSEGQRVLGAVREPENGAKMAHLRALPGAERLTLLKADVLDPSVWDGVLAEADSVIHCVAVVSFGAKDPQKEIVDIAVKGTRNVLSAAARSPRTQSVVHLSSIAALVSYQLAPDYQFSSKDWCNDATLATNPYGLAKTLSEQLAREMEVKSASDPELSPFQLAVVAPGYVLGPLLAKAHVRSSPAIVRDMLSRAYPGCPDLNFNVVDVRDVAQACVSLSEAPGIGQRLVMVNGRLWWREMAATLARRFPAAKVVTRGLPRWLLYANALFQTRVSLAFLKQNLGRELLILDGLQEALGLRYIPLEETLHATATSLFELGVVKPFQDTWASPRRDYSGV